MFKRITSLAIAAAILMSMCIISVSASGFTSANRTEGYVTEVKGTSDGNFTRSHTGGGTTRTSVTMQAKNEVSGAKGILNSYDTSNDGYSCKFAHSKFRVGCTTGFQIRIRNGSSGNIQWMNFSSGGSISANSSSGVNKGVEWSTDGEHTVDIIADVENGVGYLYYDKQLASYSTNLQKNGKWYGYLIYTAGTWQEGDTFVWRYGYSSNAVNYVLYNDTQDHTVCLEDVLIDCGVVDAPSGDNSLLFETDSMRDYFTSANGGSIDYENGSATVTANYYNEQEGYAENYLRMLSGFYPEGNLRMSGDILYITYTQQINSASRVEMRIRNHYANKNGNRMTFTKTGNGKIRVNSFSNEGYTLDKNWDDEVNVGILIDIAAQKAYAYFDGTRIGEAYDYSADTNELQDLRMYLNGTEDNATASVTISEWSMKLYDSSKDFNELRSRLEEMPVYFSEAGNSVETDGDLLGMAITAKKTPGADDVSGAKVIVAVYDDAGALIGFESWNYSDGATNDEVVFELTGDESVIKTFCWGSGQKPYAFVNEYNVADYLE